MKMIMLSNISWGSYALAVIVLLVFWYIFIIRKFYSGWLKELLNGKQKIKLFKNNSKKENNLSIDMFSEFKEPFDTLEDARELFTKLEKAVAESSQANLSVTEFKNYIRFILEVYPYVKKSSLREKINSLMVSECEKHPQLIITYPEMDGLWDEAI
jgi:agmatine/peptidylarginine deiminase